MVASHPSVGVILHYQAPGLDAALIVRQFRPPVFAVAAAAAAAAGAALPPISAGFTFELCAGILDKAALSPAATAAEEVEEECGFRVAAAALASVGSYASAIGTQGAPHALYATSVTPADAVEGGGGGVDGEAIEVLALPLESVDAFLSDPRLVRSAGLMFGLLWLQKELAAGRRVGGSWCGV